MATGAIHPGEYIRAHVMPKGVTVKAAAELMDVGRPALSNLLNGNASLSAEMAARLAKSFGANARELLDMQAAYDAGAASDKAEVSIRTYVPPFLQIKARDIEVWADTVLASRSRLAVFLRTLIGSTSIELTKLDFPGNDDAELPGWDGETFSDKATPWIPLGLTGWEFGVNKAVKAKADGDYRKSLTAITKAERSNMTFMFVTPRKWDQKDAWLNDRRAEKNWKDVQAFDARDLEQWLEHSIPAQAWLAAELGRPSHGVYSLDEAWRRWGADCEPSPASSLFDAAVKAARHKVLDYFKNSRGKPLTITADSTEEALAFLACLFDDNDADLRIYRDRIAVFSEPGQLRALASPNADFIPVIINAEIEKELAPFSKSMRSIIIYPRNVANVEPDVTLEPLSYHAFRSALEGMGLKRDQIDRYGRESGRSLTVLRRRLSKLPRVKTPSWASEPTTAAMLVPLFFSGAWKAKNSADQIIMSSLAQDRPYSEIEDWGAKLGQLEDAPIWSIGSARGLVSKIDVLFAIHTSITIAHLDRFFEVADLVLSEQDPSLDLPEKDRWMADVYGKVRDISGSLRGGISETLVLLSLYGNALFKERLGVDVEVRVSLLIEGLLTPLTTKKLESHERDLPLYAEAAPAKFLDIIDKDLANSAPQTLELMRPADSGVFGRCPRTGLLWALENIAWNANLMPRVVLILARLSQKEIVDNWINKPIESLKSIFRSWMPQTSASLSDRLNALELLMRKYPDIGWRVCLAQFQIGRGIGHYSHKPRWRTDGHGFGDPVSHGERVETELKALELCLGRPAYSAQMIMDLVGQVEAFLDKDQERLWALIDRWHSSASSPDKAAVREKIRTTAFSVKAVRCKGKRTKLKPDAARRAYDNLAPDDIIYRHEWLFRQAWIDESADELAEEESDWRKRDIRVREARINALREILATNGCVGILQLAEITDSSVVANVVAKTFSTSDEIVEFAKYILLHNSLSESKVAASLFSGLVRGVESDQLSEILERLIFFPSKNNKIEMLVHFPFAPLVWNMVEREGLEDEYWSSVDPHWLREPAEWSRAIDSLIKARRPRAAFSLLHLDVDEAEPSLLYKVLNAILKDSNEPNGSYLLSPHHLSAAFERMTSSGEIPQDQMAVLEFHYLSAFDDRMSVPNLEKQVEKDPDLFVQLAAFAFKRDDGELDNADLDREQVSRRATAGYQALGHLKRIPGSDQDGGIDEETLRKWVETVQSVGRSLSRETGCSIALGMLFAHAPDGDDGVWPCVPVRNVLEDVLNDKMADNIRVTLYNSRGAHWRDEGGLQEREIAEKYQRWADAIRFTHPRVSAFLDGMARMYLRDAEWQDTESQVRERQTF